jgi:hypothetical protein
MKYYSRRDFISMSIVGATCAGFWKLESNDEIDSIAESYVKLALQISKHDSNYLDCYIGPEEWKLGDKVPLKHLALSAEKLVDQLAQINKSNFSDLEKQRHAFLTMQLSSVKCKIDILSGKKMSFDEEFLALYGSKSEKIDTAIFQEIIDDADTLLPGKGGIIERACEFKSNFIIPGGKLEVVFLTAITEAKEKTFEHIKLPPKENVRMEFLTDIPYAAACWYSGNDKSTYQINSSIPIDLFWVISYACHEAYPGHHTYFTLIDENFRKRNKWIEFSIIPLYSPIELLSEGAAIYTLDLVFPMNERIAFGKKLASLAGLDTTNIELYFKVYTLLYKLRFMAYGEVAREYSDGKLNKAEAIKRYMECALVNIKEAGVEVRFFDAFRSYLKAYYTGWQMVENYIEMNIGNENTSEKHWDVFYELLTTLPTSTIFKQ